MTLDPTYTIGEPCFRTMRGFPYYFARSDCDHSRIMEVLDTLRSRLAASLSGPRDGLDSALVTRFLDAVPGTTWTLEAGYGLPLDRPLVSPGSLETAQLPPFPCVTLVYEGTGDSVRDAIMLLAQTATDAGLELGDEFREHHLLTEGPDTPGNVSLLQFEVTAPGGGAPELPETPPVMYGPVRVHMVEGYRLLYAQTTADAAGVVDAFLDRLLLVDEHRRTGNVQQIGSLRFAMRGYGTADAVPVEVGVPIAPDAEAPAGAEVKQVEPTMAATIICCGPYWSLAKGGELLSAAIAERGLTWTGEHRELYLHYEGDDSPNTITQVVYPLR